ncbi:hypothetical protein KK471_30535, partial [Klebsiella pneumoniae]|uniref:hypothetical protein n=1 Tax=Klebsiella pneumoniae TaxID=573 RepID=UPI001BDFEF8A
MQPGKDYIQFGSLPVETHVNMVFTLPIEFLAKENQPKYLEDDIDIKINGRLAICLSSSDNRSECMTEKQIDKPCDGICF